MFVIFRCLQPTIYVLFMHNVTSFNFANVDMYFIIANYCTIRN